MSLRLSLRYISSRTTIVGSPLFSLIRQPRKQASSIQWHHTTTTTSVEYGYIHGVEDLSDYRQGGYHPVRINDRLNKRYLVVHKLGHGSFSTVWLAVDEKTTKYVAIKLNTADADSREPGILSKITQSTPSCSAGGDEPSLLPIVLDRFQVRGPNGTHTCLVTLPARCSLRDAKEASGRALFQLDVARSLAGQLAIAVSLVHAAGYAHGDLHLGNLLLQMPSCLNSLSIEQLYERYGEPEKERIVRLDTGAAATDPGVPPYAVLPMCWAVPSIDMTLDDAKMMLSDFGVAFRPSDKSRFESYTPIVLRPPEAFFEPTTPLSYSSDIWSLGCVIFELLAHRSLIDGFLAPQDEITAQQVELQGLMPSEWWEKWQERPKWYDEAGMPLSNASDIWSWDRRFEQWVQDSRRAMKMETMAQDEWDALFELLKWMLAWRPSERPDMQEVLESKWMTSE
ncbi:hypothetical protein CP533_2304 [Ophiocordyceps camponoti-saundersi (nom. inval.)]|nr:hypothetical protein CP533_2304 [Ophiocordyceps camponoti-saundersi (nom. inval.)]